MTLPSTKIWKLDISLVSTELHSSSRVKKKYAAKDMATFFSQQADVVQLFWRREGKFVWSGTGVLTNKQLVVDNNVSAWYSEKLSISIIWAKRNCRFFIFEGRHHLRRMVYVVSVHMSTTCSEDIDSPTCCNLKSLLFENRHNNYRKRSACTTSQN